MSGCTNVPLSSRVGSASPPTRIFRRQGGRGGQIAADATADRQLGEIGMIQFLAGGGHSLPRRTWPAYAPIPPFE